MMKKEEKFHVTLLFCAAKVIDDEVMEGEVVERRNIEDVDKLFNPQVIFATSGAANTGIDHPDIYGVLRVEVPPFLEDCVQEQGRDGHRTESNNASDSYTICVSFESLLKLWCRISGGTIYKLSYQESLLFDLEITLACIFYLPTTCYRFLQIRQLIRLTTNRVRYVIYRILALHLVLFVPASMISCSLR